MNEFTDRLREDARLVILRTLAEDNDYQINERLLAAALAAMGHDLSADTLRAEVDWLMEQGLVGCESRAGLRIVTLSSRGLDVAAGRARMSGVARPRPGDLHA